MNRTQPQASRRRHPVLEWLFGSPGPEPVSRVAHTPNAAQPAGSDEAAREALLGPRGPDAGEADHTPAPADAGAQPAGPRSLIPRDMHRVNVSLPANLDLGEKLVPVRLTNISGTGAAMLYESDLPVPDGQKLWLDLALPTRQKPLELGLELTRRRPHTGPQGQDQQILHFAFPQIRRSDQDAIISYVNNLRLYEEKQYNVAAKVMLEVVTGRRRFARFNGETVELRPDSIRLMMDDFDAIAGAEVMLTIMAPHFVDHLDIEDVKVERVEVVSPRKAEVEVSLAKPNDQMLLFIRKHYPSTAKKR